MKRLMGIAALVLALDASALELTSFTGSPNVPGTATVSFSAGSSARELWYAWDGSDKGATLAAWPQNERVATIAAGATTATVELPPCAKGASFGRFFLVAAGGSYDVAWIRSTGREAIDTGIYADPQTKIVADYELDDLTTTQQFVFGMLSGNLIVASYINGSCYFAWAAQDTTGNWYSVDVRPEAVRYQVSFDLPGNLYELKNMNEDRVVRTYTMSTTRTKTATTTLGFMAAKYSSYPNWRNFAAGRFYGLEVSKSGAPVMSLVPTVQNGVAGMRDTVGGGFFANVATTGELRPGGRTGSVDAEASSVLRLGDLRMGDVWSDVQYLWDFSRDPNGDGKVTASDFRHALKYGTAAQSGWNKTPTLFSGDSAGQQGLAWTTVDVQEPSRGLTRTGVTCLDIPANVQITGSTTQTWRNVIQYSNLSVPNSITLVARVYPRRFDYDGIENATSIFFFNGLDWGAWRGNEFGFEFSHAKARPYSIVGQKTVALDRIDNTKLTTNRWYDVAYTVEKMGNGFIKLGMAVSEAGDSLSGGVTAGSTGIVYKAQWIGEGQMMTNELAAGGGGHPHRLREWRPHELGHRYQQGQGVQWTDPAHCRVAACPVAR